MTALGRLLVVMIVMLVAFQSTASAENGQPSRATLKAMGLSDLQLMSDTDALAVRGKVAVAGGLSWAYIGPIVPFPPAASINVSASAGRYYAAQANNSHADQLIVNGTVVVAPPAITGSATFSYTRVSAGGSSWARSF
ncbi:MAG: hypothetical protein WD669_12475 [Pirellulales bacterium]